MPDNERDCPTSKDSYKNAGNIATADKSGNMARDDRLQFVLAVLEDSGAAMKSIDVFRNCKLRGATFEHRTTKNYLTALIESGDVLKVDSQALGDGEIIEIETGERGHFIAASVAAEYRGDT